jgi:hypothetical protein
MLIFVNKHKHKHDYRGYVSEPNERVVSNNDNTLNNINMNISLSTNNCQQSNHDQCDSSHVDGF